MVATMGTHWAVPTSESNTWYTTRQRMMAMPHGCLSKVAGTAIAEAAAILAIPTGRPVIPRTPDTVPSARRLGSGFAEYSGRKCDSDR